MRSGWGHDDGAFFFSRPDDAAQQECCEPGFTLLCMGLFSRFFVQALPCTAEGTVCRVRDTRSLVPRAYGTNRSSSNTSCSSTTESESRSLRYLRIIYGGESHWNKGAGMGLHGAKDIELRFSRYVDALVGVIGHADRAGPFRDYCTGLMMPGERKSVEPMAAITAPGRTAAKH